MKRRLIIIGVAFVIFLGFAYKWSNSASFILGQHWELQLPEGGSEMYCFPGESNKDGAGYYAYMYQDAEAAQEELDWQETEGATNEYSTYSEAADAWMVEAEVPETIPTDFTEGPYYYESKEDGSELIMIWEGRILHVIENVVE